MERAKRDQEARLAADEKRVRLHSSVISSLEMSISLARTAALA